MLLQFSGMSTLDLFINLYHVYYTQKFVKNHINTADKNKKTKPMSTCYIHYYHALCNAIKYSPIKPLEHSRFYLNRFLQC
jgi:hypothetical protein